MPAPAIFFLGGLWLKANGCWCGGFLFPLESFKSIDKCLVLKILPVFLSFYISWFPSFLLSFFPSFLPFARGREGETEGEKSSLTHPPTGDLAYNAGMCPDWESNKRPFGSQVSTQSTEPHQPGLFFLLLIPLTFPGLRMNK